MSEASLSDPKGWIESEAIEVLLNPKLRWDPSVVTTLKQNSVFSGHIWLATSGTSGPSKFVALSKRALLISAAAVNRHFQVSKKDVWINVLPTFHVGGLGVLARAYLSGSKLINLYHSEASWNPLLYLEQAVTHQATLSALVPTQLFDLVKLKVKSPSHLRAVIIGGGVLNSELRAQAESLGWPLSASYGLTECGSQVATESLDSSNAGLRILDHVTLKISEEEKICLKSDALLSAYAFCKEGDFCFIDPKIGGWFETEDKGVLSIEGELQVFGRDSGFLKIAGENVSLFVLRERIETLKYQLNIHQDCTLIPQPNERWGYEINFCFEGKMNSSLEALIEVYNKGVSALERIQKVVQVEKIPRNALGKVTF